MRYSSDENVGPEFDSLFDLAMAFKSAMIEKLEAKHTDDWHGWDAPGEKHPNDLTKAGWSVEEIRARIRAQLDKPDGGDPVDIANYCAFWWNLLQEKE